MMHTVTLLVLTINRAYAVSAANSTTSNMTAVAVGGACQDTCAAIEAAAQIACVAGIVDEMNAPLLWQRRIQPARLDVRLTQR